MVTAANAMTHQAAKLVMKLHDDISRHDTYDMHDPDQPQQDKLLLTLEQLRAALEEAHETAVLSWVRLLEWKDRETEGHSFRVARMMAELAYSVGMSEEDILHAYWGALLHDIGKIGVPDAILHKTAPLTNEEWAVMREHTTIAHQLLEPIAFVRPAIDIPYCHHEKWDGTGYPRGLKGDDIPLAARLFAVIDVYDSLINDRPYRKAWSKRQALDHLCMLSGTHFDPRAVRAFMRLHYKGLSKSCQ
jgi:putative two-component system response regulator